MSALKIALAGNPNVGKSTVFNTLTGLRQHTGNWTGKTVEIATGCFRDGEGEISFVDLPGTYSLNSLSPEEQVAREYLLSGEADATVVVCDACTLSRNLMLVLQILSLTGRVAVCVNLLDEAKRRGVDVDLEKLSELLGVPCVGTSAARRQGMDALICAARLAAASEDVRRDLGSAEQIYAVADSIAEQCSCLQSEKSASKARRIDKVLTGRFTGVPIMLAMLFCILWITIVGANYPSQLMSDALFGLGDVLRNLLSDINAPWWLVGALVDGVYRTSAWVVSVMLPPMAIFFPLFTILEDLGVLPRIAFNLDPAFKSCGACGKQCLTMCLHKNGVRGYYIP